MALSSKLNSAQKQILLAFQTEENRLKEEQFAKIFSENVDARLFFINENKAYTDGKNIIVDPTEDDLFIDKNALTESEKFLGWKPTLSCDEWTALKVITRAQTLHECLHLLYSDFSPCWAHDSLYDTKNKKKAISLISNVIEDAYIEAVGASVYENIEHYLKFARVAHLFAQNQGIGTAEKTFAISISVEEKKDNKTETKIIKNKSAKMFLECINYMIGLLLYPFAKFKSPSFKIKKYIKKVKPLFFKGSTMSSSKERYFYSKEIFKILLPLIPKDEECEEFSNAIQNIKQKKLGNSSTNYFDSGSLSSMQEKKSQLKGKTQDVTKRLFSDLDGNLIKNGDNGESLLIADTQKFKNEKNECMTLILYKGFSIEKTASSLSASPVHKGIRVIENHPKINLNLRKAYQNIRTKYKINIESYNRRFLRLLHANVFAKESLLNFGEEIDSKKLGDVKGRFWCKNKTAQEIPDMAVLLLIDGSGSMKGARRESAMESSVILHEVLKKQGIAHCVAEHRTKCDGTINVNILLDFNAREKEELNLMQLDATGCNRDGLALYWAENYINKKSFCENRLIIVLSDGYPNDGYDNYTPPVSVKDTANAVQKISARGVSVIAVALDTSGDYSDLREIYHELVACVDLKRLTGQLLSIVSKHLQ